MAAITSKSAPSAQQEQAHFDPSNNPENKEILGLLNQFDEKIKESKLFLGLGADTELVKAIRDFQRDPQGMIHSMTEELSHAYVGLFCMELGRQCPEALSAISYELQGSRVSIWVKLQPEKYEFETRGKVYTASSRVSQLSAFKKISLDLLVLEGEEARTPSTHRSMQIG